MNMAKMMKTLCLPFEFWELIGKLWFKKPLRTAVVEPKPLVSWFKLASCAWLKEFVQRNMKPSCTSYTPEILLHHRCCLGIWPLLLFPPWLLLSWAGPPSLFGCFVFAFWSVSNVNPFSLIAWYSWRDPVHQEDAQIGQFAQLELSYHYKPFMWIHLEVLHNTQLKA